MVVRRLVICSNIRASIEDDDGLGWWIDDWWKGASPTCEGFSSVLVQFCIINCRSIVGLIFIVGFTSTS